MIKSEYLIVDCRELKLPMYSLEQQRRKGHLEGLKDTNLLFFVKKGSSVWSNFYFKLWSVSWWLLFIASTLSSKSCSIKLCASFCVNDDAGAYNWIFTTLPTLYTTVIWSKKVVLVLLCFSIWICNQLRWWWWKNKNKVCKTRWESSFWRFNRLDFELGD